MIAMRGGGRPSDRANFGDTPGRHRRIGGAKVANDPDASREDTVLSTGVSKRSSAGL